MQIPQFHEIIEPNDQTEARNEHLAKLRELVGNTYPNRFDRSYLSGSEDTISSILKHGPVAAAIKEMATVVAKLSEGERPPSEQKDALNLQLRALGNVRIAGRLAVPPRVMGKAAFVHLSDGISRLQIYVRKQDAVAINNDTGEVIEEDGRAWEVFSLLDHGDFVGVEGFLFVTNTGELSVHVEKLQFLSKAMLPMPDKMHGIADPEIRQRQRYADLIASSLQVEHEGLTTREVFETRAKTISSLRRYLEDHGYVEVETPMLTPKATGAAAKPFKTHHNALDIDLYARIAPELYLKRLVVGGFEKVYELNRNFRNEGISYKHNPEFTMLEFYCAYMDVNGMMDFCEKMLQESVQKAIGGLFIEYEGVKIDFGTFARLSMFDAVKNSLISDPRLPADYHEEWLENDRFLVALSDYYASIDFEENVVKIVGAGEPRYFDLRFQKEEMQRFQRDHPTCTKEKLNEDDVSFRTKLDELYWKFLLAEYSNRIFSTEDAARSIEAIFGYIVESKLIQPTFIVDYPKSISPLSKASPNNPQIAERFELFINGMEVANGFSELNDPKEQYDRFVDQMSERERGDEEAMILDEDYIRALSYGMPPAAGIGIGIDRLVMLLTNKHSIRDVILFPHMRPEKRTQETPE